MISPGKRKVAAFLLNLLLMMVAGFFGFLIGSSLPSSLSVSQANRMVTRLTHGVAHVSKVFPGPDGLTGIVIEGRGRPVLAWMTNSRSAILIGSVVNRKNENLTRIDAKELGSVKPTAMEQALGGGQQKQETTTPVSDASTMATGTASADSANAGESVLRQFVMNPPPTAITDPSTASGTHVLYAFVDPNCIFCHHLFEAVQHNLSAFRKAGVRVEYLPVAILKQSSIQKAGLEIAGGWPALLKDEQGFNEATEEGALPDRGASLQSISLAKSDTQLMQTLSQANQIGVATPLLVWQAGNGHVYYLSGYPNHQGLQRLLDSFRSGWKPSKK